MTSDQYPNRPNGFPAPDPNQYPPVDYPLDYQGPPPPFPPPYTGGYPYPYDPYRPVRPPGTNGLAIATLVTALVGLFFCGVPSLVAVIIGPMAMRQTRRTGQQGFGIALAGTILGALVLLGVLLYVLFFAAWALSF